jgi:hypothetical protein
MMKHLQREWSDLTDVDHNNWTNAPKAHDTSKYHAYLSYNLARWATGHGITTHYPGGGPDPTPSAPDPVVATPGTAEIRIDITPGAINAGWTWHIHRSPDGPVTPTPHNLVASIHATGGVDTWTDNTTPGVNYWYAVRGNNSQGKIGPATAVGPVAAE